MVEYDMKTVGRSIAGRRAVLCISQAKLAQATGISEATISDYESAKSTPSFKNAVAIANVLGCSTEDLLRVPK